MVIASLDGVVPNTTYNVYLLIACSNCGTLVGTLTSNNKRNGKFNIRVTFEKGTHGWLWCLLLRDT